MRVLSLSQLKFHPHNCERQSPLRRECVCLCWAFLFVCFSFFIFLIVFSFRRAISESLSRLDRWACQEKFVCATSWKFNYHQIVLGCWCAYFNYLFISFSFDDVGSCCRSIGVRLKKNPVHVTAVPDKDLPVKVLDKKVLIDQPQCCNWVKIGFIHTEKFECAIWFVCSVFEMFHSRLYNTLFQSNKLNWGKKTSEKQQFKRKRELRISLHNRTVCFFLFHSSFYMYVLLFICKSIRTKLCDCFFVGQFFFCLVFWLC